MVEAVKGVTKYCFNTLKIDFLVCSHFIENNQSRRVQEKCGFKHYKLIQDKTFVGEI